MPISPIRSDGSNAFAHDTFAKRLPQIIREVQANDSFSFSPQINSALDDLHEQLVQDAPLPPPPLAAPDAQTWLEAYEQHKGETWQNTEWFFAETYFFHIVNHIVRYWEFGVDPYKAAKEKELLSESLKQQIIAATKIFKTAEETLSHLLQLSLWGNRADLSLPEVMANQSQQVSSEDLLCDERPQAIARLLNQHGTLHFITDNFGTELAMDLVLINTLLELSIPVMLHVKMNPTYVSDATKADYVSMMGLFFKRNYPFERKLQKAHNEGRLQIAPNFYWNSPHFLNKLPAHLMKLFEDANLIILKGDANYRRAFFDTIWPVDMPTHAIVNYLPAPLLCLRTLKSDCLAGVPQSLAAAAASANPRWRTLGKYGVIQYIE